jgi:hypothetical protein
MSKYVNLASKIIDLVHAEHKAGLRAERKKTAEAKAKKVKELDPSVDDENPGFKDKEQEAIQAKSKEKEESEDDEEDEDDDPVGKKKAKKDGEADDPKDGEKDKGSDGEDEAPKDAPPEKGAEGGEPAPKEPDPENVMSTGAVDSQKKPSPPMPGNKKKNAKKVEMSGKKEKVDTKPKSESLDDQIRKREERLAKPKFSVESFKHRIQLKEKFLEIDDKFEIKDKMIAEAMWDGKLLPDMELYGKPEITQLQLYRMLELYRAAGMNLEQSCDTIEYLYGVRPVSDADGNMNFNGTQMDIQKYGRNDGEIPSSSYYS